MPDHEPLSGSLESCFSVTVGPEGADTVLAISGEVDMAAGDELRSHLRGAIDGGRRVVLDLDRVVFMDSTGLNAIVQALQQARRADSDLVIRSASAPVRRLLEVSGVVNFLPYT